MKELSLHILDIAQNSITAGASLIEIYIHENIADNILQIIIEDNGCGMSKDYLSKIKDPFFTSRKNRKVGMGIPLLDAAANQCGGNLDIHSDLGFGTKLSANFISNHIDLAPIGNMPESMQALIASAPDIDFVYTHKKGNNIFCFETSDIRKQIGNLPINVPKILLWIKEYINDGLSIL